MGIHNIIIVLITILIGGGLGTISRYLLTKHITYNYLDGLFIANLLGITLAIIYFIEHPIMTTTFCGSLTSFSSFIKNSSKNPLYLTIHITTYIFLSIFLFSIL